jgi:predicted metal-binding membrane protein
VTAGARERAQVRAPILAASLIAWAILAAEPRCAFTAPSMLSPGPLALDWALMLAAMMAPMLIAPVRYVRDRSFASRRRRAAALFVAGYAAAWTPAGVLLMLAAIAVPRAPGFVAAAAALALLWQFSPLKQISLNRCHAHPELSAFGSAADFDALRFGLTHGAWCVFCCSALMLLPVLLTHGHVAAMMAVSLWVIGERLERPMEARWRLRGPGKAARIAMAWARSPQINISSS